MSNLTALNDCAFCNFPNLETIIFWGSTKQTIFIHENAFGSITSGKLYPKIKEFDIIFTRLSTLPERLIDWRKADRVEISTTGINCDCSMAWLINDFQRSDSLFSKTIKITQFFKGLTDECIAPPEFKGKKVKEVSGKICNGKLSTIYHYPSTSSATFNFYWILLAGIFILGISIFSFIFHKKIIKFIYYQNVPQQDNDDSEKIFQYRNLENDSV
uniref:Uncharacterized protein n=1 Tax=Panagrolaimus sp. ES5 TaxID=591445 RepID=A0AC34FZ06_9BILA